MNVFEILREDHEKVSKIFEELETTTERAVKTREELFRKLKTELDIHAKIEEKHLYPALREDEETREITLEAIQEHGVVKRLLAELDTMSKDSEEWAAKLTVLKENVEHHVEEEEGEMFMSARSLLSREEIDELTEAVEAERQQLQKAARSSS